MRIAVWEDPQALKPSYLMWLEWTDGPISFIRYYRYVCYVVDDAELVLRQPPRLRFFSFFASPAFKSISTA